MLHEVEKRAISSTQRLLQPGLARAWLGALSATFLVAYTALLTTPFALRQWRR
jgi:hypothetical protein